MPQTIAIQTVEHRGVFAVNFKARTGETFTNPATMSDDEKVNLIASIRAGEVLALTFPVRVFGNRRNANLTRPRPELLAQLARKTSGLPFIRDHRLSSTGARLGRISRSAMREGSDGISEIVDVIDVTEPAAQEEFIRGGFGAFSIQYAFEGAECSKCGESASFGFFGPRLSCECTLGKTFVDSETGRRHQVEVFTSGNKRLETSVVNLGAYADTEILSKFEHANHSGVALFGIHPLNQPELTEPDKMEEAMPQPIEDTEATPEPIETDPAPIDRTTELLALLEKANSAAFKLAFTTGVRSFKFGPAQHAAQKVIFKHLCESDVTAYAAHINDLPANPAFSTTPTGATSAAPSTNAAPDGTTADLSLLRIAVKHRFVSPDALKPENAARFSNLRFN